MATTLAVAFITLIASGIGGGGQARAVAQAWTGQKALVKSKRYAGKSPELKSSMAREMNALLGALTLMCEKGLKHPVRIVTADERIARRLQGPMESPPATQLDRLAQALRGHIAMAGVQVDVVLVDRDRFNAHFEQAWEQN